MFNVNIKPLILEGEISLRNRGTHWADTPTAIPTSNLPQIKNVNVLAIAIPIAARIKIEQQIARVILLPYLSAKGNARIEPKMIRRLYWKLSAPSEHPLKLPKIDLRALKKAEHLI